MDSWKIKMQHQRTVGTRSILCVTVLALLSLNACATTQDLVTQKEDTLAAAGFVVRPANTPARQAMLNKLPPHHFVQRIHGDAVSYVYADPLVCNCLYVGSQRAYGKYRQEKLQQNIADQQEMTAQMYSDPSWDWGAWGPFGSGYGFDDGFRPGF